MSLAGRVALVTGSTGGACSPRSSLPVNLPRRPRSAAWPCALLACWALAASGADPLPALHAQPSGITVSGVSSGGYMAVQMHVAHSASIAGAGVIAGGPYYCAQGSVFTAFYNCMTPGWWTPLPPTAALKAQTDALSLERRIDSVRHLENARAWLFTGANDRTVRREVVESLRDFYLAYKTQVTLVADKPAGHAMVTEVRGSKCGTSEPPFIVDCDYDAAGALLTALLGKVKPRAAKETGRVVRFDQSPYASDNNLHGRNRFRLCTAALRQGALPHSCRVPRLPPGRGRDRRRIRARRRL